MSSYSITSGISPTRIRRNRESAQRRQVVIAIVTEYVILTIMVVGFVLLVAYPVEVRELIFGK